MTLIPALAALGIEQTDPIVASFTVAGQIRMTTTGTTARLQLALPDDVTTTPAELVPALLTLGKRVLEERRLLGQELPEVEVTGIEQVDEVPSSARATGFTVAVTNDFGTRRSRIGVDSDLLMVNDGGALLVAATLIGAAEYLLAGGDSSARHCRGSGSPPPVAAPEVAADTEARRYRAPSGQLPEGRSEDLLGFSPCAWQRVVDPYPVPSPHRVRISADAPSTYTAKGVQPDHHTAYQRP